MVDKLPAIYLRGAVVGLCASLLLAAMFAGCVSKKKADAQARAAYLAGQRQAAIRMQQAQTQSQGASVTINGEVRNHVVPWAEGMTLSQALVEADYLGAADPGQILIVRNGRATRIEAKQLLSGAVILLQPGDIVQLMPPAAPPLQ